MITEKIIEKAVRITTCNYASWRDGDISVLRDNFKENFKLNDNEIEDLIKFSINEFKLNQT